MRQIGLAVIRSMFITLVLVFPSAAAAVAGEHLVGVWEAGDRPHAVIHGFLRISHEEIYFSPDGKSWGCKTRYVVSANGTGEFYRDPLASKSSNQTWKYWKIRLDPSLCTESTQFLFVLRPHQSNYAAFIDYTNAARPCCWVHLRKRLDLDAGAD